MNNIYCIIGAGSFGLMTALQLRNTYKNAKIIIFDKNKDLSSSVNGGNGIINNNLDISYKNIKNVLSINYSNKNYNIEFYLIHSINYLFNNILTNSNKKIIDKISINNTDKIFCENTSYYKYDYWENIINKLPEYNIELKNMTEIINYKYKDNNIIITSINNEEFVCNKLILCTAGDLNLVKNKYYHKFIEIFSGYICIIEVKNPPKCFILKDNMFITPYYDNYIKISLGIEINSINTSHNIDINDKIYDKISEKVKNNKYIQNLGIISIKNIWKGSRAMTYDTIPFIDEIDKNIYLFTGGSYNGAFTAYNFAKWMVELIDNKSFTNLPIINNKLFNPKLNRLENIKIKYYTLFILLLLVIMSILYLKNN
jgi:hypothetical protein